MLLTVIMIMLTNSNKDDNNNNDSNDHGMVSSISCNDDYDIIALIDYYIH